MTHTCNSSLCIGIDFGGVLSIHDSANIGGQEHRSTAINVINSLESLKILKLQGHQLYINSFCGKSRAIETKHAINEQVSGLFEGLFFVKSKKYKGLVTKYLGCDVMIDDTLDILSDIQKAKECPNLVWFTGDPTFNDKRPAPEGITVCDTWEQIVKFCATLKPSSVSNTLVSLKSKIHDV